MAFGEITKLTDRGFGFIKSDQTSKEIFFHVSALQGVSFDDLYEGQRVSFSEGQGDKGPRAEGVTAMTD
jgi:CspA family cold shock protein